MNIEEANAVKIAAKYLYEDINGQALISLLENMAGKYSPNYNPENSTSIILAQGRTEMMQTLRNLDRLTAEQILELVGKDN